MVEASDPGRTALFRKILIANRGEIAVRIIRACAEMGIRSAAIFSDADRFSLHVKKADESYSVGSDPLAGYLNVYRIANLAVATGCDAVHPGYGFLSENPALAEACERRGIAFIGPTAEVIRRMGDKTEARFAMQRAGVPVTPGTDGNLESEEAALAAAEQLGYPVMLKATSGGGGRGIRRCDGPADLRRNYERVISEATKAFGRADVFMEKCVVNPRHLEVQILGDNDGNVVHLYERDCSIQRRNQKLIEIAPSPQLDEDQRAYLCELGVTAARAVGYTNAGTVEFLMDADGAFYFMEMNTRVQVEHTVSESITGVDIVEEQIRIAAGLPLRYGQDEITRRGYAIQFRINAEDPQNNFLPSFGKISRYYAPGGPGVRTDTAIYTGYSIPPHYDSMIAKVIVWALSWEDAIQRGERALRDMGLYGIRSTIPFYREILRSPQFREGRFDTGFIESHPDLISYCCTRRREDMAAALAVAVAVHAGL
jgi:pyruvate carboxylase subunit A